MPPRKTKDFIPGTIVEFKKSKRIVLEKVTNSEGEEMYHIFAPDKGVYTAFPFELKYVDTCFEWLGFVEAFNKVELPAKTKRSA